MKVFCWDFDGTLAFSNSLWSRGTFDALKSIVPETDDSLLQEIRVCMQCGFPWHTPDADYTLYKGDKWWELMENHFYESYIKCGVAPGIAKTASKNVRPIIKQTCRYTLFEDTIDTLRILKEQGAVNILLTNNYPDFEEVLEHLGLSQYFSAAIISAVVGYNKPRKEIFELAKEKYPSEAYYMIGDNIKADILGGKQNGMRTVLVHKGFSEHADYCFDKLRSVLSLI